MSITHNRLQAHWNEARGFIHQNWPKFTKSELDHINGDYDRFLAILKDLYGGFPMTEAIARSKLQRLFNQIESEHPESAEN